MLNSAPSRAEKKTNRGFRFARHEGLVYAKVGAPPSPPLGTRIGVIFGEVWTAPTTGNAARLAGTTEDQRFAILLAAKVVGQ